MPPLAVYPEAESDVDIEWLSRDSCASYIDRRRDRTRRDEEALELARDDLTRTQKETEVQGLCKLNKDVRKLTIKEFNAAFACDVIELIRRQMEAGDVLLGTGSGKKRFRAIAAAGGSQRQVALGTGLGMKTPAPHVRGAGRPPMTRTARRGERIICTSENGSPIDQFDHGEVVVTAKKRRAVGGINKGEAGAVVSAPFPISIGIGAGNGETIDLSDPNQRRNMNGEQKAQAIQQLMAIQEQMNKLMAEF